MSRFRCRLLVLAAACHCPAAITFVQQCAVSGNATALTCTMPANITAGHFLAVIAQINLNTVTVTSITGCTATFTQDKRTAVNQGVEIWSCTNATGGSASITCNFSAKSGQNNCQAAEFTGVATSAVVDTTASNSGNDANPITGNAVTANADDLLIAGTMLAGTAYSSGPTNSFTRLTAPSTRCEGAYRIVSATGTYSTDWTWSQTRTWDAALVAYKAAAAGGTVVKDPIMRGRIASPR